MEGKNPWNTSSFRKTAMYRLLLDLGGEARWKDLKMHLDKLGWGPTTLKQTLDKMVKEGSMLKEARLGEKGPEAWYVVVIKDDDVWKPVLKSISDAESRAILSKELKAEKEKGKEYMTREELAQLINEIKDTSVEQVGQKIREKAEQLKGMEREIFLKTQMRKIIDLALEELRSFIYMEARGCKISKETPLALHWMLSTIFNKDLEEYLKVLIDYPDDTMKVLLEQMIKDEDKREEALRAEGLKK